MNTQKDLPEEVRDAIHANRKIEAIKLLREQRHIGLKEAKDVIEAYAAQHPELLAERPSGSGSSLNFVIILSAVAAAIYGAYRLLA